MLAKLMARHKRTLTFLANLERHKSIITKEFKIKCRLSREMQVFLDNLLCALACDNLSVPKLRYEEI